MDVPLLRCLDSHASFIVMVNRVVLKELNTFRGREPRSILKKSPLKIKTREFEEIERSPTIKNIHSLKHNHTRTEYEFNLRP